MIRRALALAALPLLTLDFPARAAAQACPALEPGTEVRITYEVQMQWRDTGGSILRTDRHRERLAPVTLVSLTADTLRAEGESGPLDLPVNSLVSVQVPCPLTPGAAFGRGFLAGAVAGAIGGSLASLVMAQVFANSLPGTDDGVNWEALPKIAAVSGLIGGMVNGVVAAYRAGNGDEVRWRAVPTVSPPAAGGDEGWGVGVRIPLGGR